MAGDIDFPRIWGGADVYVATVGTTAPTDVATAWPAGWEPLGLLDDEAGLERSVSRTVKAHTAWGVGVYRKTSKGEDQTLKIVALEDNPIVHDLIDPAGTGSTTTGVTTRALRRWQTNPKAFGLELVDGDIVRRLIVPRGEVVDPPATIKSSDSSVEMYEIPITCYADETGQWAVEITDNPAAVIA